LVDAPRLRRDRLAAQAADLGLQGDDLVVARGEEVAQLQKPSALPLALDLQPVAGLDEGRLRLFADFWIRIVEGQTHQCAEAAGLLLDLRVVAGPAEEIGDGADPPPPLLVRPGRSHQAVPMAEDRLPQ